MPPNILLWKDRIASRSDSRDYILLVFVSRSARRTYGQKNMRTDGQVDRQDRRTGRQVDKQILFCAVSGIPDGTCIPEHEQANTNTQTYRRTIKPVRNL